MTHLMVCCIWQTRKIEFLRWIHKHIMKGNASCLATALCIIKLYIWLSNPAAQEPRFQVHLIVWQTWWQYITHCLDECTLNVLDTDYCCVHEVSHWKLASPLTPDTVLRECLTNIRQSKTLDHMCFYHRGDTIYCCLPFLGASRMYKSIMCSKAQSL